MERGRGGLGRGEKGMDEEEVVGVESVKGREGEKERRG